MSLWGTLNVAKSALAVNQAALQTIGNNIANAGNEDYSRQRVDLHSTKPQEYRPGLFLGTGVDITDIRRQVDDSLNQRMRSAISDAEGDQAATEWLTRLESVYNELGDNDLSTSYSNFFNSWSDLANKPQDMGLRQVVVQRGQNLADQMKGLRTQMQSLRSDVNERVKGYAGDVDSLFQKVADLNRQIATAEVSGGSNNALQDDRDAALKDLSKLVNITVHPRKDSSVVDVSIGNEPVVIGTTNRGIRVRQDVDAEGNITQSLVTKDTDGALNITSGVLGAVVGAHDVISSNIHNLDKMAQTVIFELNKIHSAGQGLQGFSTVTSEHAVDDETAALNTDAANLPFTPTNGSFVVRVKDKSTGAVTSTLVNVDLDGTGTQTSLQSLAASIDAIPNISATITGGRLTVSADSNAVDVGFSQDSSGVLATLGIGNFFTGQDANDIAVNDAIVTDPRYLAASKNGQPADNQTAKAIAALETTQVATLNGRTLKETYEGTLNDIASRVAGSKTDAAAAAAVRDTLASQREAVSGVSLDEEAIALMRFQRAYQSAAKVVSATDEMLQTVLNLVR
ncbi:MAG: flagellar hook-associated protein FlgK [Tepidisphaeraceae bacterium]